MPKAPRKKFAELLQEISIHATMHVSKANRRLYKKLKKHLLKEAKKGENFLHTYSVCLEDDKVIYRLLTNGFRILKHRTTLNFFISWDKKAGTLTSNEWTEKTLKNITIPKDYEPSDIESEYSSNSDDSTSSE